MKASRRPREWDTVPRNRRSLTCVLGRQNADVRAIRRPSSMCCGTRTGGSSVWVSASSAARRGGSAMPIALTLSFVTESDDTLLVATVRGFVRLHFADGRVERLMSTSLRDVQSMAIGPDRDVFLGVRRGVIRADVGRLPPATERSTPTPSTMCTRTRRPTALWPTTA